MLKRILVAAGLLPLFALVVVRCGSNGAGASFKFSGKLASLSVRSEAAGEQRVTKTVTHVMAVNPESSNPERKLSAVSADGSFTIDVSAGRPWVLVFVDQNQTGKDMIVGLVKMGSLDTLPARTTDGSADLGTTTLDGTAGTATPGASLAAVLTALGITSSEADVIGAIDNVAARYANPDIDGNGVIDLLESKSFQLDFHMRWDHKTPDGSTRYKITDMADAFLPSNSTIRYTLGSAYAQWKKAFDTGTYVSSGTLQSGVTITFPVGNVAGGPISYEQNDYGDMTGFGPSYSSNDMPGSAGTAARYVYGFNGKTLTFTNVVTYPNAELNNNTGRLMPFVKFTTSSGAITSLDYQWMKLGAGGWQNATVDEVALVVGASGGYASLCKGPRANGKCFGLIIPATAASGSVAWTYANLQGPALTAGEFSGLAPSNLCNFGLSYDDKLGMRIFDGFDDPPGC